MEPIPRPALPAPATTVRRRRPATVALAIATMLAVAAAPSAASVGLIAPAPVALAADPAPAALLDLQIAGGYQASLATDYGTAVSVPNGTYVTFRVILQPAVANAPVEFWQRTGKAGAWTFLSTGRTDAAGGVIWSRAVRVPAEATGYDRYIYFRVAVPDTADYGAATSEAVTAVASDFTIPRLIGDPVTFWDDGVATWYCLPGVSRCTNGYPPDGMYAALARDFGIPLGSRIAVCHGDRCVTVTAIDVCEGGARAVDLYAAAFLVLAPLGAGRIDVTVEALPADDPLTPPVTSPAPGTPAPQVTVQIAGGYQASLATDYGTAVSVPNGTYVTFRVILQPAVANAPVEFWQRTGKAGAWTFLSTGRTDAAGGVIWSRAVRVPAEATGYDRYIYFRVAVPDTSGGITLWSTAVRTVAK